MPGVRRRLPTGPPAGAGGRLRGPLAALLALVLLVPGCSLPFGRDRGRPAGTAGATTPAPVTSAGAPARWRDCPEVAKEIAGQTARNVSYECATVAVPRDWAKPDAGRTFDLALLRARSGGQRSRIGSLVLNPGGPGGSGIEAAVAFSFGPAYGGLPDDVLRRFDVVGFDPRGVGRSTPVKCMSDADLDASFGFEPDPVTQAEFDALVALNRRIAAGCTAKYGADLALFSTEQAARDMEAVRAAVGDAQLTYLGFSYGTLLGATYAQLFPTRIRAFVLDGAVDPRQDPVRAAEGQAKGFERAFSNFAAWCARAPQQCPIGPDARSAVMTAIARARSSPVRNKDGRQATAGWVFYAVVSSLYTEAGWQKLATAIDRLADGDPTKAFELADDYAQRDDKGHYSNVFDAFVTVSCTDDAATITTAQARALQGRWRAAYPLFGPPLATGLLPCTQWPSARDPYPTGPAKGAPPIVVVGTTGDPATPYEQTAKLATMLGVGRVLTWEGEGHTAYPETACVTAAVNRYLIDLQVPPAGLRCPKG